jgi:type IV secretory pathway TrbF-like protein
MNQTNPYLDPGREWNERYGSFIKDRDNWKLFAFISSATALLSIAGLIYVACLPKLVPYAIRTDGSGGVKSVEILSHGKIDDAVILSELSEWILAHRSVSFDTAVQERNIQKVYAFLDQGLPATTTIDEWYKANDPYKKMSLGTVNVRIIAVLNQSPKTYQIDFTETSVDLSGKEILPSRTYRSIVSIEHKAVSSSSYLINPTGTYIGNITFQQIGG